MIIFQLNVYWSNTILILKSFFTHIDLKNFFSIKMQSVIYYIHLFSVE